MRDTDDPQAHRDERPEPGTVPIRSLDTGHRDQILAHLQALEQADRYLRFGYAANDEQIRRYVDQIDFERDVLFGIFNRRLHLIAMAHLAFSVDPQLRTCPEFGVSVAKASRGKGYGSRLFERAVVHARNEGVSQLFIHALSENTAMLKIARNAGAVVERDGPESDAWLKLPPDSISSQVGQLVGHQVAEFDYQLKLHAQRLSDWLSAVTGAGSSTNDAGRHPSE